MKKKFVAPTIDVKKVEANNFLITASIPAQPGDITGAAGPVESHGRIW